MEKKFSTFFAWECVCHLVFHGVLFSCCRFPLFPACVAAQSGRSRREREEKNYNFWISAFVSCRHSAERKEQRNKQETLKTQVLLMPLTKKAEGRKKGRGLGARWSSTEFTYSGPFLLSALIGAWVDRRFFFFLRFSMKFGLLQLCSRCMIYSDTYMLPWQMPTSSLVGVYIDAST